MHRLGYASLYYINYLENVIKKNVDKVVLDSEPCQLLTNVINKQEDLFDLFQMEDSTDKSQDNTPPSSSSSNKILKTTNRNRLSVPVMPTHSPVSIGSDFSTINTDRKPRNKKRGTDCALIDENKELEHSFNNTDRKQYNLRKRRIDENEPYRQNYRKKIKKLMNDETSSVITLSTASTVSTLTLDSKSNSPAEDLIHEDSPQPSEDSSIIELGIETPVKTSSSNELEKLDEEPVKLNVETVELTTTRVDANVESEMVNFESIKPTQSQVDCNNNNNDNNIVDSNLSDKISLNNTINNQTSVEICFADIDLDLVTEVLLNQQTVNIVPLNSISPLLQNSNMSKQELKTSLDFDNQKLSILSPQSPTSSPLSPTIETSTHNNLLSPTLRGITTKIISLDKQNSLYPSTNQLQQQQQQPILQIVSTNENTPDSSINSPDKSISYSQLKSYESIYQDFSSVFYRN